MRHTRWQPFHLRILLLAVLCGTTACGRQPTVEPVAPIAFDEKLSWILRLENQRILRDPAPAVERAPGLSGPDQLAAHVPEGPETDRPDLTVLLSDPERQLRRRAALAIGRVGLPGGVDPLVLALGDPEVEVRKMSAFALGLLADPRATPSLVGALDDPSPAVQGRAAEALARIGDVASAPAIGAVAQRHLAATFVLDPDDTGYPLSDAAEAFRLAVYALGELQAYEPLASVVLQDDGQPVLWWWPVVYALQRTADPRALDALITLAGVQGNVGVALAAQGLGVLGRPDPRAIDALVALLDRDQRTDNVVYSAVEALGRIDDPRVAASLRSFVLSPSLPSAIRAAVLDALAGQSTTGATDVFVELLSARWPPLRVAAVRGLARTNPDALMLSLSSLPPDSDWRVRAALADGLSFVDADAAEYRLKLILSSAEEDARVIPAVLRSLASHGVPDLRQILLQQLGHEDVVVRKTVAELLSETATLDVEVTEALVAAFEQAEADPSYLARAAMVEALASGNSDRAGSSTQRVLARAIQDDDWAVRVKAAELDGLPVSGLETAEQIRPAPGRRSLDFAAPHLVRPSVSPHVYIETERGTIELELEVIDAPVVADNFANLARRGFYDGLTFHRVIGNYVAQGGDPRRDSEGGPGYTLRDELSQLPHLRGSVGLARDWADTGGSQFFIVRSPQPQLDGRYTVFAHVVSGMEVVDELIPGDEILRMWVWDGS